MEEGLQINDFRYPYTLSILAKVNALKGEQVKFVAYD